MHNQSKIETFINSLNFSLQDLIEFLPIGILLFDENWKIKSVNNNFLEYLDVDVEEKSLEGANLFSYHKILNKIPLKEVSLIKEGKYFEKLLEIDNIEKNLVFKGSPIFKDSVFGGGILVVEEFNKLEKKYLDPELNQASVIGFLKNICNCFLVLDLHQKLQYVYSNSDCSEFSSKIDIPLTKLFSSETSDIETVFYETIKSNKVNYTELIYFSDKDRLKFNSVFVPFSDELSNVQSVIVLLRDTKTIFFDTVSFLSNASTLREFESFATISADGLFKVNLHGNIIYWTEIASELFNVSEHEINSKFIGELFPEINADKFDSIRAKIFENGSWDGYLVTGSDTYDNLIRVKIISKVNNNTTDLYVYCKKIDKKDQQIILAKEEEKLFFRDAVVKSNQMILQTNPHGTILFANEIFCDVFDYELDEIRGMYFNNIIEENFKEENRLFDFENFVNNSELEIIPFISNSEKIIEACCNINISSSGSEVKYFTIYIRKCRSDEKLFLDTAHALLYSFTQPLLIVRDNSILKVNPQFCEVFGSEFETDFYGLSFQKILDEKSYSIADKLLNKKEISEEDSIVTFKRTDDSTFDAQIKKIFSSANSSYSVLSLHLVERNDIIPVDETEIIKKELGKIGPYYWKGLYINNELTIEHMDEMLSVITGYPFEYFTDKVDFFKEITHPNDVEKFFSHFQNPDKTSMDSVKEITYRLIRIDGEIIWIKNRFKIKCEDDNYIEIYGSISNVTDWTLEREELKSIITELDKLNTAKEKFISIISHDLKSPFTSIVGFSELILTDTSLSKDEILEYVSNIKDASLHTVDLLNGLLDLTKLQTGRIEVEPKIINANYITKKSVEILSGLAFQKGLSLSTHVDNSIYIIADDNLLFQVFNNLVANSIKFTPKGGKIEIFARELTDQQKIEFTVKDTGIGIDPEDVDKLFVIDKKFTTLGTDGERGTGLGLSLVKEIIDKHGGKIEVRSELEKGTEFIFSLPLSSPTILILDTNQSERVLYSKLLESITDNVEIVQSNTEEEAIRLTKEKMPMLIIFEHKLTKMTGDEFIGEIKKAGLIYEPSLMVLTRYYSEALKNSYLDIGVDEVFSKPFELKNFKSQLDKLIGKID